MSIIPQRELKYRAWTGNRMIQVVQMDFMKVARTGELIGYAKGFFTSGVNKGEHTSVPMKDIKIRPYTRFKAKNGVEIYEKDIVELIEKGTDHVAERLVVNWIEEDEYGYPATGYGFFPSIFDYVVIGNIYETPELLEGVSNE